ncbi:MAG: D-alanyl-D-alanine carboxypeptidase, partial [Planctomycetota bacterium]
MQRIKETTCGVERRCGGAPSACPRVRWSVLLSTLLVSALPALGQDLSRRIEASFNRRAALAESAVSVRVSSIENGRLAASFDDPGANGDGRRTLIPASNMKLLTTGAALLTLGPDYQFETTLLLDGDRLILRGGGDPAFGDPALLRRSEPRMSTGELLERLAAAVEEVDHDALEAGDALHEARRGRVDLALGGHGQHGVERLEHLLEVLGV